MPAPEASVCVVVKDRRDLMAACLAGIASQQGVAFEVVIVDNGSTDGTRELCQEWGRSARVSTSVTVDRGSLGHIRNVAVGEAAAPIIAFVDSDCVPAPDWLAQLVRAFEDDPMVACVQGQTRPDPTLPRRRRDATQDIREFTRRYECCNIAYRREALVEAGGFDESVGFFGEDSAAGWSVRRLGYDEKYCPEALVHHTVAYQSLGWHLRRGLMYGNWNALVARFPEMRDEVLWNRVFLRARNAKFALAVLGLALGLVRRPALLLALPYLWYRRPVALRPRAVLDVAEEAAFDAAVFIALVRGSIRTGTLVL